MSSQGFEVRAFRDKDRRARLPAVPGGAWRSGTGVAALALAGVLLAPPASAQLQDFYQPQLAQAQTQEAPARETTAVEQAAKTAGQALITGAIGEFEPATYADVLRDPDNLELNFRYALTQVRSGNLRGAAAALERIVLIDPNQAQVRLVYAVVLFRLDNVDEAEREFKTVASLDIADEVRAQVNGYLERIQLRRRVTRYTALLSLGVHYDTNRTAAPLSGAVQVTGLTIPVNPPEGDFGYIGIGNIRVDHDLGFQERHELFGSLSYYHDEMATLNTQDLQSFNAEAGGVYRYRGGLWDLDIIPSVFATHLRLSRETFFEDLGGNLRLAHRFNSKLSGYANFRYSEQRFEPIKENTTSELRDGDQIEGMIGATYVVSPKMRVNADYMHFYKDARANFFTYNRDQIRFNHIYLLGGGQFLLNHLSLQIDRYDTADPFVSSRIRKDQILRYRITYGAPLVHFFGPGILPKQLEDVTFGGSIEWLRADSNLPNFNYNNWKLQALLTKKWQF